MKKLALLAAGVLLSAISGVVAHAATLDPLHIECAGCVDNGTNTPLPSGTAQFGFSSSPPGTAGTLFLLALVPDTVNLGTFVAPTLNVLGGGFSGGLLSLVSATPWTSGDLNPFLGGHGFPNLNVNASPANTIGAYLPATQALDGLAVTGFDLFIRNVGATGPAGLTGPGIFPPDDLFQLGGNLPVGSYVIAMLVTQDSRTGEISVFNTANSGAGIITTFQAETPLPAAFWMFATGLGGLGLLARKRRKQKQLHELEAEREAKAAS